MQLLNTSLCVSVKPFHNSLNLKFTKHNFLYFLFSRRYQFFSAYPNYLLSNSRRNTFICNKVILSSIKVKPVYLNKWLWNFRESIQYKTLNSKIILPGPNLYKMGC